MNALSQSSGMVLCVALALTTLLATESSTPPFWLWEQARPDCAKTSWLPWVILVGLGLASCTVTVLHPMWFAAAFGQELPGCGSLAVVPG